MHQPPRRRTAALLDRPLMLRAYLVLGVAEAVMAMGGYLLTWRMHELGWDDLRRAAPLLLHGQAGPVLTSIQHQASSVAFTCIVAGQIGAALACRSERRSARADLGRRPWLSNPLLLLGMAVEVGFTALLLGWPPLAGLFAMPPFDARLGPLVLLTPLVVILADDLHKFSSKYLGTKKPAADRGLGEGLG